MSKYNLFDPNHLDRDYNDSDYDYNDLDYDYNNFNPRKTTNLSKQSFETKLDLHLKSIKEKIYLRMNKIMSKCKYGKYFKVIQADSYVKYSIGIIEYYMLRHNHLLYVINIIVGYVNSGIYIKIYDFYKHCRKINKRFKKKLNKAINYNFRELILCKNIQAYNEIYAITKVRMYNKILKESRFIVFHRKYNERSGSNNNCVNKFSVICHLS
ncbi:hypothetical protein QLL95_gp0876 [Cotonvirus japonicus]|uniref:Uncharacterized protein n=1 Tax=Cotonvirus japonicus TaxID=2811091 RepID=A0ABM7NT40_9VIRU|nr:hypothetical protein QLL95_gp0876 [Cotonvirus japonicus]BCS83247.1 hypothetical protein [Cotonvirus japonicus]